MQGKILIVEDNVELAELYALYLGKEGFECHRVTTGEQAVERIKNESWNLVILDINLPRMDGFQVLETTRKLCACPVMLLSARDSDEDLIHGLGVGADDFVTKPCPPRVLTARVRAHIRRSDTRAGTQEDGGGSVWQFGPFTLDAEARYLSRDGVPVPLSMRETGILVALAEAGGKSLSPEEMYDRVWNQAFGDISAVGVYIQRLRRKIEDDISVPFYIQTIYGMGYRLNPESLHNAKNKVEQRRVER